MRAANYILSATLILLGFLLILFMLTQQSGWSIGMAIGALLVINGVVRFWFALREREPEV